MNTTTPAATPVTTTITNLAMSITIALGISRAESRRLAREILSGEWPTFTTFHKEGVFYLWKGSHIKDPEAKLFRLGRRGAWEYRSR